MKKYILQLFFFLLFLRGYSQEYLPDIQTGTRLEYLFDLHGQQGMITMVTQMQSGSLITDWELGRIGIKGTYIILPEALAQGNRLSVKQLVPFHPDTLEPDETFCLISRSAFQNLLKNNRFVYNQTTYVLDKSGTGTDQELEVTGKMLDVLHVTAQIDATEMWILNDPDFPVICRMIKNPLGINFSLTSVSGE